MNVRLVAFDEMVDHAARIERVLRQPVGCAPLRAFSITHDGSAMTVGLRRHMLLVGESGAGKTTLTRFVAWMMGMSVSQVE